MMSPSIAHHLVSDVAPFALGNTNWRVVYSFRKESFSYEARSSIQIIGALNFATVTAVRKAITVLKHASSFEAVPAHPYVELFGYDFDAYGYVPNADNYSILRDAHTDTYCLNASRGLVAAGAMYFPKAEAIEIIRKLNQREIIL